MTVSIGNRAAEAISPKPSSSGERQGNVGADPDRAEGDPNTRPQYPTPIPDPNTRPQGHGNPEAERVNRSIRHLASLDGHRDQRRLRHGRAESQREGEDHEPGEAAPAGEGVGQLLPDREQSHVEAEDKERES